jgi:uncharacterized protein Smg (DUF494 family)
MSNLTQTVNFTRKIIIGFIVFSLVVIIFQVVREGLSNGTGGLGGGATSSYLPANKQNSEYVRFPFESLTLSNFDAPEFVKVGDFKEFPSSVNVYSLAEKQVTLSPLQQARDQAEILELDANFITIDANTYRWIDPEGLLTMEFKTVERELNITSDLFKATSNSFVYDPEKFDENNLLNSVIQILEELGIATEEMENADFRVDYLRANQDGTTEVVEPSLAQLVRISVFEKIESATLVNQNRGLVPSGQIVAQNIESEIMRPDIINGAVTVILNGEASNVENLVYLHSIPFDFIIDEDQPQLTTGSLRDIDFYKKDVFKTLEIEAAFDRVEAGAEGSNLAYLVRQGDSPLNPYSPLAVRKFSIDAAATKVIYIEPEEWGFIDSSGLQRQLFPYYWFEGIALLEDGTQADFAFIVDVVPK